jgi:murein DD-endopeptidase MepM/ murein hydrolase activator NlpD
MVAGLGHGGAVSVEFPLRGEWVAITSPGDRVPSHGTDILAQRYAYDFMRLDEHGSGRIHPGSTLRQATIGVPVHECYGWGEPIHMPFDGQVVATSDGYPERRRVVPLRELALALKNALTFDPKRGIEAITGNYVIARSGSLYAAFVHLVPGSIVVRAGQALRAGDVIGRVGHTGNSTAPHLHFQLMDGPDALTARAVPCAFRRLEVRRDGAWELVTDHVPRRSERIRYAVH